MKSFLSRHKAFILGALVSVLYGCLAVLCSFFAAVLAVAYVQHYGV